MSRILTPIVMPAGQIRQLPPGIHLPTVLEAMVRAALVNTATELLLPSIKTVERQFELEPTVPSVAKRIRFLDRHDYIATGIRRYFEPIVAATHPPYHEAAKVAWATYMFILAAQESAQVYIDMLAWDIDLQGLAAHVTEGEAAARVAVLRGLFRTLRPMEDLPGFRIIPGGEQSFRERADEILDDAYMLDASAMRRFLSFESNSAAVRRDLRKLLSFISRKRPWAKGAVDVAEHVVFKNVPGASQVAGLLAEVAALQSWNGAVVLSPFDAPWNGIERPHGGYWWAEVRRSLEVSAPKADDMTVAQLGFF